MKNHKTFVLGMLVVPIALLGMAIVVAGPLAIPNTFTANTPAVAAEVNANFAAVETAVDDNDMRITALEGNRVLASGENLRIVQGLVNTDGTIFDGMGFTVAHTAATGSYQIDFDTAMSGNASIAVQGFGSPGDYNDGALASTAACGVTFYNNALAATDTAFTFICVGPN